MHSKHSKKIKSNKFDIKSFSFYFIHIQQRYSFITSLSHSVGKYKNNIPVINYVCNLIFLLRLQSTSLDIFLNSKC